MFETCTHTAKSPIIPTNEIDTEPRSNDANIFSTRADDEAITTFAPAGGLNTLFSATNPININGRHLNARVQWQRR